MKLWNVNWFHLSKTKPSTSFDHSFAISMCTPFFNKQAIRKITFIKPITWKIAFT